jgi:hypothetical protein
VFESVKGREKEIEGEGRERGGRFMRERDKRDSGREGVREEEEGYR